jgi:hypothetical protein
MESGLNAFTKLRKEEEFLKWRSSEHPEWDEK